MASCHETRFCSLACSPCAPGGGAASGMHDIDVIALNEFFEGRDVFKHNEWVFGMHGHVDVLSANASEFMNT